MILSSRNNNQQCKLCFCCCSCHLVMSQERRGEYLPGTAGAGMFSSDSSKISCSLALGSRILEDSSSYLSILTHFPDQGGAMFADIDIELIKCCYFLNKTGISCQIQSSLCAEMDQAFSDDLIAFYSCNNILRPDHYSRPLASKKCEGPIFLSCQFLLSTVSVVFRVEGR